MAKGRVCLGEAVAPNMCLPSIVRPLVRNRMQHLTWSVARSMPRERALAQLSAQRLQATGARLSADLTGVRPGR